MTYSSAADDPLINLSRHALAQQKIKHDLFFSLFFGYPSVAHINQKSKLVADVDLFLYYALLE